MTSRFIDPLKLIKIFFFLIRFRHLDTKVHFKSKRENARKSPSPENLAIEEDKSDKSDKSPKFTPVQRRKFMAQQHPNSK